MLLENNPYPRDVRVRSEAESLVKAGHRVLVIAPGEQDQARRETVAGVEVIRFRLFDGAGHGPLGFLAEYLVAALALHAQALRMLAGGATVLHLHNPPDILFPAGALYRLAGRKVVFDHHDLFPETVTEKTGSKAAGKIGALCQRLTFAVANHVLVTNESFAELARRSGKAACDITIVRNGPPSAWLRVPHRNRAEPLQEVSIGYVGAISTQDGVEGLIPIIRRLRERGVQASVLVIGDGDARPGIERACRQEGIAETVRFVGRVAADRVAELLADLDLCIDPAPATDLNERSTMTKIAEYLALGKPVVAYDLLETRRTTDGAAVLVAPGDAEAFASAIEELARDPELRQRLSDAARHRATELTWARSEQALLRAYAELRARRRPGRRAPWGWFAAVSRD